MLSTYFPLIINACRGKKKRGLVYKDTSLEDDGYLIDDEKRWTLGSTAMTPIPRAPEDEVQEVTIEMKEDDAPPLGKGSL